MVNLTRREINLTELYCLLQWIGREMDVTLKLVVLLSLQPLTTNKCRIDFIILLLSTVLCCSGVSVPEQLAHIARRRQENVGFGAINTRRRYNMQGEGSVILGAPSFPSHLPEAEPILSGHTLLRPALGMLKSAVKFPHKEMENGAGVYGNINNLGIKYDGRNERLMYSGFRRTPTDLIEGSSESDSSSEEETRSQLRKNPPQFKNTVKRMVKIFPAKPINKGKIPSYKQDWSKKFGPTQSKLDSLLNQGLHVRSNPNIKRNFTSRLHSSAKTLLFLKSILHKISNAKRRQDDVLIIKPQGDSSDDSDHDEVSGIEQSFEVTEPSRNQTEKYKWYWTSKDAFNHIIINSDAPDHEEHLPSDAMNENDLRNWWYYHQADFKPFNELDD